MQWNLNKELLRLIANNESSDENQYNKVKDICDDEEMLSNFDLASLRCLIQFVQERVQQLTKVKRIYEQ